MSFKSCTLYQLNDASSLHQYYISKDKNLAILTEKHPNAVRIMTVTAPDDFDELKVLDETVVEIQRSRNYFSAPHDWSEPPFLKFVGRIVDEYGKRATVDWNLDYIRAQFRWPVPEQSVCPIMTLWRTIVWHASILSSWVSSLWTELFFRDDERRNIGDTMDK